MQDRKSENIKALFKYLPISITKPLSELSAESASNLCEIRIRAFSPVILIFTTESYFITSSGRLTPFFGNDLITLNDEDVKNIFNLMCNFSVYSLTDNIVNGFITVENGCRVGVYGTAVTDNGKISSVRNIKGLNIRISGSFSGVSDPVVSLFKRKPCNVLICGPPSSGKTTLLKDLSKKLSDELNYKIALIDERSEFESDYIGFNTDSLTGYPKASGIEIAVRTLSPQIIICDELGSFNEVKAVSQGLNCGVNFIMSVHCNSKEELLHKEQFVLLKSSAAIDYCAFIENKSKISKIMSIEELYNAAGGIDNNSNFPFSDRSIHSFYV